MSGMFRHIAFALSVLAGCAGAPPVVPAATPLYPYWTLARMPSGPRPNERPPAPTASAVLIAPGYLLTTIAGMGDVADDFGRDPAVFVFDGVSWHEGRYVDRDKRLRVALIRADVPGTPVRLPKAAVRPFVLRGLAPLAASAAPSVRTWRGTRCREIPLWMREDLERDRTPTLCSVAAVQDLPGAAILDADGALAGIQVNPTGSGETGGPDAAEIRAYLDLYFVSWGAAVKPRPAY